MNQQIIHVHPVQCCSNVLFAETCDVNQRIMLGTQISMHIRYWGKDGVVGRMFSNCCIVESDVIVGNVRVNGKKVA